MKGNGNNLYMLLILIVLIVFNYKDGGSRQVIAGTVESWNFFISKLAFPILMAVLITGQVQVLVTHHRAFVETWLAGGKGYIGSVLAGVAAPLGITMLPTVRQLWVGGIVDRGILMTFLVSSSVINACAMSIRWPFLGARIMYAYITAGIILAVLTALFFWIFGKYLVRIL